jgi:GT2 family glycosyltransferase
MELSIIILNYKMRGLVKNCIKAILESDLAVEYEIIVVDNGSDDGVEEMLKEKFPQVKFIQNGKNLGMGAGNNAGIRQAPGDYIAILNPDIFVFPDALSRLLNYLKANNHVGLAAPKLLNPDRTLQLTCYRWHRLWTPFFRRTFLSRLPFAKEELSRFLMDDWDHQTTREVDWIQGSCWLLPKKIFNEVGLFDERFFMYFEDTDFCRRIHQAGYKVVYLAEAEVVHLHRRQSADGGLNNIFTNRLTRIHVKSWLKYIWKWRQGALLCEKDKKCYNQMR